jgi:hypothetical protein
MSEMFSNEKWRLYEVKQDQTFFIQACCCDSYFFALTSINNYVYLN